MQIKIEKLSSTLSDKIGKKVSFLLNEKTKKYHLFVDGIETKISVSQESLKDNKYFSQLVNQMVNLLKDPKNYNK